MNISSKVAALMLAVLVVVTLCIATAAWQVDRMMNDGRVVNQAGIVRGGTQRLVKLELAGRASEELTAKLDGIVNGLIAGDEGLGLPKADDDAFRSKMSAVKTEWEQLKKLVADARGREEAKPALLEASEAYFKTTNDAVFAAEAAARAKVSRNKWVLVGFAALIGGVVLAVWRLIQVQLSRPLADITGKLEAIAGGDLTVEVPARRSDEIGQLAGAATRMAHNLRTILSQASGASVELAAAAEELSATTVHIASSNEEVSVQSHGVASAAEQMSATVAEVARSANAVNEAATDARAAASEGAEVISGAGTALQQISSAVTQAADTVKALGERSQQIGVVIEMIQDIADQTNLLALNAAIEAARAGEHGRGFAVVADEVRKLAEKTMKATHQISGTIASIQEESQRAVVAMDEGYQMVETGKGLGGRAGEAIRAIEGRIQAASEQTQQIAVASAQLAATVRDVAGSIDEIAKGVGQNTASAVEIAQTAESVSHKADELKDITGRFRI